MEDLETLQRKQKKLSRKEKNLDNTIDFLFGSYEILGVGKNRGSLMGWLCAIGLVSALICLNNISIALMILAGTAMFAATPLVLGSILSIRRKIVRSKLSKLELKLSKIKHNFSNNKDHLNTDFIDYPQTKSEEQAKVQSNTQAEQTKSQDQGLNFYYLTVQSNLIKKMLDHQSLEEKAKQAIDDLKETDPKAAAELEQELSKLASLEKDANFNL